VLFAFLDGESPERNPQAILRRFWLIDPQGPLLRGGFGPPPTEQQQILDYVTSATEGLRNGIARAKDEILLLREYRARLISDVVTGKLDVREVSKELPEETCELASEVEAEELVTEEQGTIEEAEA